MCEVLPVWSRLRFARAMASLHRASSDNLQKIDPRRIDAALLVARLCDGPPHVRSSVARETLAFGQHFPCRVCRGLAPPSRCALPGAPKNRARERAPWRRYDLYLKSHATGAAADLTQEVRRQLDHFLVPCVCLCIFKADLANVVFHDCPRKKDSAICSFDE